MHLSVALLHVLETDSQLILNCSVDSVRLKSSECLFAYLFDPSKTLVPQKESVPFHNVRFNVSSANSNVPLLSSKLKVKSASVFKVNTLRKFLVDYYFNTCTFNHYHFK